MPSKKWIIIACVTLAAIIGVLLGFLLSQPDKAISSGEQFVGQSEYDQAWRQDAAGPEGKLIIPDRPNYQKCAQALIQFNRNNGLASGSQANRVAACRQRDREVTDRVSDTFIKQLWLRREAERLNITVSNSEINQALQQKQQTVKNFSAQIAAVGGEENAKKLLARELLTDKLAASYQGSDKPPSEKQLKEAYQSRRKEYRGQSFAEARPALLKRFQAGQRLINRDRLDKALAKSYRSSTFCKSELATKLCRTK